MAGAHQKFNRLDPAAHDFKMPNELTSLTVAASPCNRVPVCRIRTSPIGVGAFIMGVMDNGMSIMGIGIDYQQVIKGLVLLAAVIFDVYNKQKQG